MVLKESRELFSKYLCYFMFVFQDRHVPVILVHVSDRWSSNHFAHFADYFLTQKIWSVCNLIHCSWVFNRYMNLWLVDWSLINKTQRLESEQATPLSTLWKNKYISETLVTSNKDTVCIGWCSLNAHSQISTSVPWGHAFIQQFFLSNRGSCCSSSPLTHSHTPYM